MPRRDRRSRMPRAPIGGANTLWFEDGPLFADNTDGYRLRAHLRGRCRASTPAGIDAVLGAGGAARASSPPRCWTPAPPRCASSIARASGPTSLARHFGPRREAHTPGATAPSARATSACWSTPPRSAWPGKPPLAHRSRRRCPRTPSSPIWSTCRWRRRCCAGAGARPRHRRRARHAAAPGDARLRELVRRPPEVTAELRALVVARHRGAADARRRPHRLDRHGQVARPRGCSPTLGVPGVRRRRRGAPALRGGAAVAPIEARFPGAPVDGEVDRERLCRGCCSPTRPRCKRARGDRPSAGARGRSARSSPAAAAADAACRGARHPAAVRGRRRARVDCVIVVSAPAEVQRAARHRAARHDGGEARPDAGRQMPDADKRARADFVVDTGARPRRRH